MSEAVDSACHSARIFEWAASSVGASVVVGHTRLPTVRPAWRIDLQGPRGDTTPFVIRCARPAGFGLSSVYSLPREARILRALRRSGLPVPAVRAESSELDAVLLDCLPGRSDFDVLDGEWKRRVVDHFVTLLVRLHAIPVAELEIDDVVPRPVGRAAHALQELDVWESLYLRATHRADALLLFALRWLREHAPESPETVLVQGDTGPNQCLFDDDGVVAVLDWELAHFGDPMEDLGWIAARSFFAHFGDLPSVLRSYSSLSGRKLDYGRIGYYRVMALAKCAIATGLARDTMTSADDPGSIICWDVINRYALAWSLQQSLGPCPRVEEPRPIPACEPLHRIIADALHELARRHDAPYESLRIQGLGDCAALLGMQAGGTGIAAGRVEAKLQDLATRVGCSAADRLPEIAQMLEAAGGRHDAEFAAHFVAGERRQFEFLQAAFGSRGRIYLEPLA